MQQSKQKSVFDIKSTETVVNEYCDIWFKYLEYIFDNTGHSEFCILKEMRKFESTYSNLPMQFKWNLIFIYCVTRCVLKEVQLHKSNNLTYVS